jgi:cobalt/nickel transport system ATP-binding protein
MLEVDKLYYSYPDGVCAINGFTCKIRSGINTGLIGPNGAGKTSLAFVMVGLVEPAAGEIRWKEKKVLKESWKEILKEITLTFTNPDDQLFMPTVVDDVAFSLVSTGMAKEKARCMAYDFLKRMGLSPLANRFPGHLSSGEKRLVALAGALISEPHLLILDEPTAFLDPYGRRQLINFIKTFSCAKLCISHDLRFIKEICSEVILMDGGKNVAEGSSSDILSNEHLLRKHRLEV